MGYFGVGPLKSWPDNHGVGFNPREANSLGFGAFSRASVRQQTSIKSSMPQTDRSRLYRTSPVS